MILNSAIKTHHARRRGFSLTELAMVLGVIGMILSSLWSVVSTVREKVRREQAINQVVISVRNIRDFYMGRGFVQTPSGSGSFESLTHYLLSQGVLPPEMIRDRSASTLRADLPWGPVGVSGSLVANGTFAVDNTDVSASPDFFRIELRGLSYANCVALGAALGGDAAAVPSTSVRANNTTLRTAPVTVDDMTDDCDKSPSGEANLVDVYYRLRVQH